MRRESRSQMMMLVAVVSLAAGMVLVAELFWAVTPTLIAVVGAAAMVVGVFSLALPYFGEESVPAAGEVAATEDESDQD